jgi:hypothetical protein
MTVGEVPQPPADHRHHDDRQHAQSGEEAAQATPPAPRARPVRRRAASTRLVPRRSLDSRDSRSRPRVGAPPVVPVHPPRGEADCPAGRSPRMLGVRRTHAVRRPGLPGRRGRGSPRVATRVTGEERKEGACACS